VDGSKGNGRSPTSNGKIGRNQEEVEEKGNNSRPMDFDVTRKNTEPDIGENRANGDSMS